MASRHIYQQTVDEDVQQNEHTCPECSGRVTTNRRETVCDDCGLVIAGERIDRSPEWREFDDDSTTSRRAGSPNTVARHDRGIGTEIGWGRDSDDRQLTQKKQRQLTGSGANIGGRRQSRPRSGIRSRVSSKSGG